MIMTKIKIGDVVYFYDTIEKEYKKGTVVEIDDEECEVYVEKEYQIYYIRTSMLKK